MAKDVKTVSGELLVEGEGWSKEHEASAKFQERQTRTTQWQEDVWG